MSSYSITTIEGIGPSYGEKLVAAGVKTTGALLKRCAGPKGRKELAATTGISETMIRDWTNMSDLMRIKGVGEEYSELLEKAGVDTVKELKHRNPANLHKAMAEVNAEKKLVRQLPSETAVADWVDQAKELPATMTY